MAGPRSQLVPTVRGPGLALQRLLLVTAPCIPPPLPFCPPGHRKPPTSLLAAEPPEAAGEEKEADDGDEDDDDPDRRRDPVTHPSILFGWSKGLPHPPLATVAFVVVCGAAARRVVVARVVVVAEVDRVVVSGASVVAVAVGLGDVKVEVMVVVGVVVAVEVEGVGVVVEPQFRPAICFVRCNFGPQKKGEMSTGEAYGVVGQVGEARLASAGEAEAHQLAVRPHRIAVIQARGGALVHICS